MKKYVAGLLAVVLAVGFTAFTTVKKQNNTKFATFYLQLKANKTAAEQLDPANYNQLTEAQFDGITCPSGSITCKFIYTGTLPPAFNDGNSDNIPDGTGVSDLEKRAQ